MVEFNVTNLKRSMKIICAGAPKTGTKSFARALRTLGYDKGNQPLKRNVFDFQPKETNYFFRVLLFKMILSAVA